MKKRRPCQYHRNTSYYQSGECKRCVNERYLKQKASGRRKEICAAYLERKANPVEYLWPST